MYIIITEWEKGSKIISQVEDKEWIALWIEVPKTQSDVPYHRRGKRDLLNNTYSIDEDFIKDIENRLEQVNIGDNSEIWHNSQGFINARLKPGTPYRIGITAENEAGPAYLYYSAPIMTLTKGAVEKF